MQDEWISNDQQDAADHEAGHALVGSREIDLDWCERSWIGFERGGWGGTTLANPRFNPTVKQLAVVALGGPLAEAKARAWREGIHVAFADHAMNARTLRNAALQLRSQNQPAIVVEISIGGRNSQASLSLSDAAGIWAFSENDLTELVERASHLLEDSWDAHIELSRLIFPGLSKRAEINANAVQTALVNLGAP